tara:strand:- start:76 stop:312 length:237 start_codon:yes stop_codon:yes gene_type:complete
LSQKSKITSISSEIAYIQHNDKKVLKAKVIEGAELNAKKLANIAKKDTKTFVNEDGKTVKVKLVGTDGKIQTNLFSSE